MVTAAHNPLLSELYGGLVETLRASIDDPTRGYPAMLPEHDAVLEAVRRGDAGAAARASAELLDHVTR
ncbi:Transcriptional regulators [Nocardioides sp. J9]|nr:FCD domain-containing protein [Nocardioides sp. J9]TWH01967.1 Transcriptional regulators [Nocardioides sp. J9]